MRKTVSNNFAMTLISAALLVFSLGRLPQSLSTQTIPVDYFPKDNFATPHDVYTSISLALIDTRSDSLAGKSHHHNDAAKDQSCSFDDFVDLVRRNITSDRSFYFREATTCFHGSNKPAIYKSTKRRQTKSQEKTSKNTAGAR